MCSEAATATDLQSEGNAERRLGDLRLYFCQWSQLSLTEH